MASNYNCHLPGPGLVPAHVIATASCPLANPAHGPLLLPLHHDVIVKSEPRDDDVLSQDDGGDGVGAHVDGDNVSSHDVIKADLGPAAKEAPSGRTVLGITKPSKGSAKKRLAQRTDGGFGHGQLTLGLLA